jgi:hypothetical protein
MPSEILFPHLSSTGPAPNPREVLTVYRHVFSARVAGGSIRPFILPYDLYGMLLLFLYLCIPHTKSKVVYWARWPVLAVIHWFQWKTLLQTSSMNMAIAFASGLVSTWGMAISTTWLVFYRPQFDAKRVQRRVKKDELIWRPREPEAWRGKAPRIKDCDLYVNGVMVKSDEVGSEETSVRHRSVTNGAAKKGEVEGRPVSNGHLTNVVSNGKAETGSTKEKADLSAIRKAGDYNGIKFWNGEEGEYEYYWQSYPDNLWERVPWVLDLLINFRGPGWNWVIPTMPDNPYFIKKELGEPVGQSPTPNFSSTGVRTFTTRQELINYQLPRFIIGYFVLDFLKTTLINDPYFIFGPNTYALPPHLQGYSPLQLHIYRSLLSCFAVVTALEMVFLLPSIVIGLLFGPSIFGLRAEPWYFATTWGSFSTILDKGLNGLWGSCWHQIFRFVFAAPSNYLIRNGYVKAKSTTGKLLALFFAFGISGALHGGGSVTQLPKTYPHHALIFFILQALGIIIQMSFCSLFPQLRALPKPLRQAGNFLFTFTWLLCTGWLLVDDFSRGGVWFYEPIPISPLRGLGYGPEGDGWWCWGDQHLGIGWYTGRNGRWWESGVSM